MVRVVQFHVCVFLEQHCDHTSRVLADVEPTTWWTAEGDPQISSGPHIKGLLAENYKNVWQQKKFLSCNQKQGYFLGSHSLVHEHLRLSPGSFFLRYSTVLLCCKAFITVLLISTEISCLLLPLPVASTSASATLVQAFVYLSAIPMDCDEAWDLTLGQSVCTFKEIYICYQNI